MTPVEISTALAAQFGPKITAQQLTALDPWAVVAPSLLLAILSIGTNTFTDAVARANLGESRAEELTLTATLGTTVDA